MQPFCGNYSLFWDYELWNTEHYPKLSNCFQQVGFNILPSLFLLLLSPYRIYHLAHKPVQISLDCLSKLRVIVSLLLCVLPLADVFRSIYDVNVDPSYALTPADWLAYSLLFAAMVMSAVLVVLGKKRGGRYFGGLFVFWLLMLVFGMFRIILMALLYNENGRIEDPFRLATFSLHWLMVIIQFILSLFPETVTDTTEKSSPILRANFLSRLTFWWFTGLIIKGYKKPLEHDDLHDLNPIDKTAQWNRKFEGHWNKASQKCVAKYAARNDEMQAKVVKVAPPDSGSLEETNCRTVREMDALNPDGKASSNAPKSTTNQQESKDENVCQPSLILCLAKVFSPNLVVCVLFKLAHDLMIFINPLMLKLIIQFVKDPEEPAWRGYIYGMIMFTVSVTVTALLHQYFYNTMLVGMRLKAVVCSAVYNKALKLDPMSRRDSTVGEIVNLMSVDAQKFMDTMTFINIVWSAPLQIILAMTLLWQVLGASVLAGIAFMAAMVPINAVLANMQKKLQAKQMTEKDARVRLMSEVLNGIKVLKLYAWEESFQRIIDDVRQRELVLLKKSAYLTAATSFFWQCAPFLVACSSFTVFVLSSPDNVLDAEKAFVSLALFNIMRFPMGMLPNVVTMLVQLSVSVKRVSKFLSHNELPAKTFGVIENGNDCDVSLRDSCFSWEDHNDPNPTLSDINLDIKRGELIAVVGMVGSGKSSLMSAMLGDMLKVRGSVCLGSSSAYVPQQAWIQNATLRDNILFGDELDTVRYQQVLEACALNPDLDMLPARDLTEIGEKGINLSGGQKARVSLARAVYNQADIYFLDDPLSAVDAHVGKHIFEKVIGPNSLLRARTRILVTHGIGFLPQMDRIVVMKDGKISEMGSYKQLLSHAGAFAEFIKNYFLDEGGAAEAALQDLSVEAKAMSLASQVLQVDLKAIVRERATSVHSTRPGDERHLSVSGRSQTNSAAREGLMGHRARSSSKSSYHQSTQDIDAEEASMMAAISGSHVNLSDDGMGDEPKGEPDKLNEKKEVEQEGTAEKDVLIQKEKSQVGNVKISVFALYIRAASIVISVLTVLCFAFDHSAAIGANIWLSRWSDDNSTAYDTKTRDLYVGVYGGFGVVQAITSLLAATFLTLGAWLASRSIHRNLLVNLLHCPMSFFNTTPNGRILNRLTKDINTVDVMIPQNIRAFLWCTMVILGTVVVISLSTPIFIAVVAVLAVLYILIQRLYVTTSRQLKRIESVAVSPIYSHFDESIQGAASIRAYNRQQAFINQSMAKIDIHQQAYYHSNVISNRWLSVRLEFIGSLIVLSTVLLAVYIRNSNPGATTAGFVALAITYALNITNTLNAFVRMTSSMENNIVAVERIKEYTDVDREAEWMNESKRAPVGWPVKGCIVFDNFSVRYREGLELVLRSISCQINGGEKVGIVGRTGAGKSSFALALFRIIEKADGEIRLDDVAIDSIGLHDLRKNLTIIPQDPVLFSGTLRMNLDPFQQYTDEQLWQSLEMAHLKQFVLGLDLGLEFICAEGGSNLSVGQRQLVCLARALLRNTKVLVLDEATAAVDLETDDLIQSTVRSAFSDCTVLTIAHRINTIMDYDRIMVLCDGKIKEFASPQELLSDRGGLFYSLAKEAKLVN